MTLTQAIGVIIGANIGTTITAQIIAFKVTDWALLMIAVGYAGSFFRKARVLAELMKALAGIGVVFLGMQLMSDGVAPLRYYQPFLDYMETLDNPWLAVAVGALFTAAVQSSSVTTGIVIVMAAGGLIPLPVGVAVILGSNIGTCVTAMLAAIGKPVEAVRVAVAHTLFNVIGAVVWLLFVNQLANLAVWISPVSEATDAMTRRAEETPRQIANAHTIFNVTNALVMVWFVGPFAKLVERIVPARPVKRERSMQPRYIAEGLLESVPLALAAARQEVSRLGVTARRYCRDMMPSILTGDAEALGRTQAGDDAIDALHGALATYLSRIAQRRLSKSQTNET
ncbi:MAG: Na/Pi symporter, partial [Rhodospirillales bacterium]|nr:Na/Pi symporter [Rhodospirillales bacterium]